jgi:integrase
MGTQNHGAKPSRVTAFAIKSAEAEAKRTGKPVEIKDGHGLRFTALPDGDFSWPGHCWVRGKGQIKLTFKDSKAPSDARAWFTAQRALAKRGIDPRKAAQTEKEKAELAQANLLRAVSARYFQREENKPADKKLRTLWQRKATFERLILPTLGGRAVGSIKRSEIVKLLDHVEETRGARMADEVKGCLQIVFTFYEQRSDDFTSPIGRMPHRRPPKERMRQRLLSDDEIKRVWGAASQMEYPYGWFMQFLLATGVRRSEAGAMVWSEISADGQSWIIPGARTKNKKPHLVPLSSLAQSILAKLPRIDGARGYVFTATGKHALGGHAQSKARLDDLADVRDWRTHDTRRVVRSLMSRIGIRPDIAELAIGHTIGGLRQVYDQHPFTEERRHAFEALASELQRIIDPSPAGVVVGIKSAKRA